MKRIGVSLLLLMAGFMATADVKKDSITFEIIEPNASVHALGTFYGDFLPGDSIIIELGYHSGGNDLGVVRDVIPVQLSTYNYFTKSQTTHLDGYANIHQDTLIFDGYVGIGFKKLNYLGSLIFNFKRNGVVYRTVSKRVGNSTVTAIESNSVLKNDFLMINTGENVSIINNGSAKANFEFYDFVGVMLLKTPLGIGQTLLPISQHGIYLIEVEGEVKQRGKF